MPKILSLGFDFKEVHYSFLARVKETESATEYHITVMNGDLEKLLYGNHIITEVDGQMQLDASGQNDDQLYLKLQIEEALTQHLRASQS